MNFKDLNYFIAVAEQQHFGKAAQACFVSQPTLSMQLKKLERELGTPLFERSTKKVMLTAAGQALLPKAKEIVQQVEALQTTAQALKNPLGGTLRLGAIPTIAPYLLPKITPQISQKFPELTLLLEEHQTAVLLDLLHQGKLDAAILALPIERKGLIVLDLFREPFLLAVPADHPSLNNVSHVKIKALEHEPLLLLEEGHCLRDQTLAFCEMLKVQERRDFRATSLETLRQMVLAKAGLTVMPEMAVDNTSKAIRYLPFAEPAPYRDIVLVCREGFPRFKLIKQIQMLVKSKEVAQQA